MGQHCRIGHYLYGHRLAQGCKGEKVKVIELINALADIPLMAEVIVTTGGDEEYDVESVSSLYHNDDKGCVALRIEL